ncbi:protein translocase subunit SecF [Halanaerobiaceae bacterium Z-7014]|uniref:Protein-export membrane protein SecF n=1 Tax=Halonatronomonas betaini TaxID=2778430 RepID=A0A931F6X8_9FIRM|nr:protein translocase subunit SecF [Halonatronomonas betaini]MBF8436046.1 protein translocase subunit SecF [Halonatronomonas betaini]
MKFTENLDLMSKRKLWFTISGAFMVLALLFLVISGLNLGIDFQGGSIIEYSFTEAVDTEQVRGVLQEINIATEAQLQDSGDAEEYGVIIRSSELSQEEIQEVNDAMAANFEGTDLLRSESIGAVIGEELRMQALLALLVAAIAIVIYISFRFEFKFAITALMTLAHDVVFTIGVFALLGREINTAFIAALLTIIGYSINDTIVIFDRIRENMKIHKRSSFTELANRAVVDTLPRSINTSMTTLVAILAIYLFGGAAIQTFMLALFVGMAVGTYSSIFVASPILVSWQAKVETAK